MKNKTIELLSPAKNSEFGITAINFGADAVYIGSPKFSARSNANNSIKEIEKLCNYAHKFNSKVYVALNTILYEKELQETEKLISDIYNIGADAIIIQDMGILEMNLPPIPLHASTQTHNVELEKIIFLEKNGFQRVVLARELSFNQIKEIKINSQIELEVFVHGALCVSYSGQCYMSQYIGGRSGNRGECAQPCRLKYNLYNSDNQIVEKQKYLLSLKDMKRLDYLEDMIDIGISSFKIEGRLKDKNYLKNITSLYRKKIDEILEYKKNVKKTSNGIFIFDFNSDSKKTFNRKYTDYFFDENKKQDISSENSPKSLGESLGRVTKVSNDFFQISTNKEITNGDGLCFFNKNDELTGLRVEKVEKNRIYAKNSSELNTELEIYRNFSHNFVKEISKIENCRFIPIQMKFSDFASGFQLILSSDFYDFEIVEKIFVEKQIAKNQHKSLENISQQLKKTGGTIFLIKDLQIDLSNTFFIPVSQINELRRNALASFHKKMEIFYKNEKVFIQKNDFKYFVEELDYTANISNSLAENFYKRHGVKKTEKAFEIEQPNGKKILMTTKFCLKQKLGLCEKYQNPTKKKDIKYIEYEGRRFLLEFDCRNCQMKIIAEK